VFGLWAGGGPESVATNGPTGSESPAGDGCAEGGAARYKSGWNESGDGQKGNWDRRLSELNVGQSD